MKVLLNWLEEYVDINLPTPDLAHRLTMNGLAVEGIVESDPFPGVVIGKVLQVEKHPNADKLSLTKVDTGSEVLDIVCGAPNVAAGQLVAVAKVGTKMPHGLEIKKAKIRGAESSGMICSKSELGFEEGKSPGIWELDAGKNPRLGVRFAEYMGLSETIFDIDVTSNRPDCLSVTGIAREVAVIENTKLKWPHIEIRESSTDVSSAASVAIEDGEGCPRYSARVLRGVTVGQSPSWLVKRLEAVGLRSINGIVDVTNYVMLESGQPLHAFDYDQLSGRTIVVRKSRKGEEFASLDGKIHKLNDQIVMICDAERAVALGGIMGGKNSEVSDRTTNILLEAAYFDPLTIRRGSNFLGIGTDASTRFGRGIDVERVAWALDRAAGLMQEIAGGEVLAGSLDIRKKPAQERLIPLRLPALARLLAKEIPQGETAAILEKLECRVTPEGDRLLVVPPSCRLDLNAEIDLIEEVARLYGYNNLPTSTGAYVVYDNESNIHERLMSKLRSTLRELGVDEVSTNSMVQPRLQSAVVPDVGRHFVRLLNPISDDMAVMRVSLLPGLLEVLRFNFHRDHSDVRIYEIGRTYRMGNEKNGLADEDTVLAGCFAGNRTPVNWDTKRELFDFFDLKRVVTTICKKLIIDNYQLFPYSTSSVFDANSLELTIGAGVGNVPLGHFGKIRKSVLREFDITLDVWAFELEYPRILELVKFVKESRPVPRFPAIKRDLAFVVDVPVTAGELLKLIRESGGRYLEGTEVFDLYQGDQVGPGKKSLAFSLAFQARDRTLTEEEVDHVIQSLILKAGQQFGAQLRT